MIPRHPETLWLLAALIPYGLLSAAFLSRLGAWLAGGGDASLAGVRGRRHLSRRIAGAAMGGLFWALAVLAAAGFSAGTRLETRRADGAGVALVLDVSNSMLSRDAAGVRLERALDFIRALRAAAPGARWSLVAFRGRAVTLCPPTDDALAFESALSWAGPAVSDEPGSSVGAAIMEASAGFAPGAERLIIVLSDGNDTGSDARLQAARAAEDGARLAFVGVGGAEASPVADPAGKPVPGRDGLPVSLGLNEDALAEWARASGGTYRHLDDPRTFPELAALAAGVASPAGGWISRRVAVDATPALAGLALAALAAAAFLSRPPARPGRRA